MAVYFIQAGENGPVKIGFANHIASRLASLQSCCPETLVLLRTVDGNSAIERAYHRQFASQRLRGEWFTFHEAMLTNAPDAAPIGSIAIFYAPRRRRQAIRIGRLVQTPRRQVIKKCGGPGALARLLGVSRQVVHQWFDRGMIPSHRQDAVLSAARQAGIDLAPADFFEDPEAGRPCDTESSDDQAPAKAPEGAA